MFPITEGKHRLKLVSFRGRFVSLQTHIKRVVGVGPAATFRNDKSTRRWRHLWGGGTLALCQTKGTSRNALTTTRVIHHIFEGVVGG